MSLRAIEAAVEEAEIQVLGVVRRDVRLRTPSPRMRARAGDILVIEAEPEGLESALTALGITLEEAVPPAADAGNDEADDAADEAGGEAADETAAGDDDEVRLSSW